MSFSFIAVRSFLFRTEIFLHDVFFSFLFVAVVVVVVVVGAYLRQLSSVNCLMAVVCGTKQLYPFTPFETRETCKLRFDIDKTLMFHAFKHNNRGFLETRLTFLL